MNDDEDFSFKVETQSFRFISKSPISLDEGVNLGGASSNGQFAVIKHSNPRAMVIIEPHGSIVVHGISSVDAATAIAKEILLKNGKDDKVIVVDKGQSLSTFSLGRSVLMELAASRFSDIEVDNRLNAIRIDAKRHRCTILLFNNGKGVIMGQTSRSASKMAAHYWHSRLEEEGALA